MTGSAGKGCGGISVNLELLDEYVTGAVLDIKQRTENRIAKARKEYDKLSGAVTVFGDEFDWRF